MKTPSPVPRRNFLRYLLTGTAGAATLALLPGCATGDTDAQANGDRPAETGTIVPAGSGTSFDLAVAAPGASAVYPYALPDLPYAADALDAAIDAETMQIHHGRHHQGYTNKLNAALESYPELQTRPLIDLLADLYALPEDVQTAVLNNGGGYLNHAVFWPMMASGESGSPTGTLSEAIDSAFGSYDTFKERFTEAALGVFGSGWAWLARDETGALQIVQTPEQEPPHASGFVPVLGIDVWEHAYYLRYQNRRADYVESWFNVVNWDQAARNLDA
ncbi:MAG: superoxide dismutase [Bacteroidota bacterium]